MSLDRDKYIPILESCIIGLVAGLSAVLLSDGVRGLGALRVHLSSLAWSVPVLPIFGLTGGLIAGLLVEWVAPEASGSGIPQVRARLDRILLPLDLRIALVKLLGGMVALGSGLFLGREGPTVQLGAALAAPLSRWLPTTAQHRRQLIAAGAGAGLTAAFNAPLAGVTFVLEELLKEIKPSTVLIAVIACAVSCFTLNTFGPAHLRAAVSVLPIEFHPVDIPFFLLLGIVAGVVSAVFNAGILGSLNLYRKARVPVTARVAFAGLVSGLIISVLPDAFHNYAAMRTLIVTGETPFQLVLVAFLEFYLLTLIAYGSGAPGGLFAPSLALGSAVGYMVGYLEYCLTGTGSPAAFALVGMGAFFAGVARTPLTAIVITFELTSNFALLTPLMFSCVISSAMGEFISRGGLYDHLMVWNGIHLHGPGATTNVILRNLQAQDVMHRKVESLERNTLVKDALKILGTSSQRGFPVLRKGRLVGIVTQTDLLTIDDAERLDTITVADIMTPHPVAVSPFDSLEDILFLFTQHKFTWLPVTSSDKLKGIILQSDVLNSLFSGDEQHSALLARKEKQAKAEAGKASSEPAAWPADHAAAAKSTPREKLESKDLLIAVEDKDQASKLS